MDSECPICDELTGRLAALQVLILDPPPGASDAETLAAARCLLRIQAREK